MTTESWFDMARMQQNKTKKSWIFLNKITESEWSRCHHLHIESVLNSVRKQVNLNFCLLRAIVEGVGRIFALHTIFSLKCHFNHSHLVHLISSCKDIWLQQSCELLKPDRESFACSFFNASLTGPFPQFSICWGARNLGMGQNKRKKSSTTPLRGWNIDP